MSSKRKQYILNSRPKVVLAAIKNEETVAEPAKRCGMLPIMTNNWKRAFVKGDRFIEVFGETNISWYEGIF
ncbi:MAG: hypothetical protein U9P37_08815 [Pseudomonadota bacterium]|nr:hypothetical protein [Pseudomonadota bacterium]